MTNTIIIISLLIFSFLVIVFYIYKKKFDLESGYYTKDTGDDYSQITNLLEGYKKLGQWHKAFDLCRNLLEKNPKSEKIRLIYAELLFDNRKYNEAITCLTQILSVNKMNQDATKLLAKTFLKTKQVTKAKNIYQTVIGNNPDDTEALIKLAEIHVYRKEKQKALQFYKKAIPLIQDEDEQRNIRLLVADLYSEMRDWTSVISEANLLLETYPDDRTTLLYLKKGYIYSEDYNNAIKILSKLLDIEPLNPKHHEEVVALYFKTEKYTKVIKFGQHALTIPKANKALINDFIAKSHIALGEKGAALEILKKNVNEFQKDIVLKTTLADLYCEIGQYTDAIALFREYLEIATFKDINEVKKLLSKYYFNFANYLFQKGDTDMSFEMYDNALIYDPDNVKIYTVLAEINLKIKNYNEAIRYFKFAIQASPQDYTTYLKLANIYYEIDNYIDAGKYYKESTLLKPDLAVAHAGLGLVEAKLKKPDSAIESFKAALDIEPLNVDIRYNLALAFELAHNVQAAISEYKKVLELNPEHKEAKNNLEILNNMY